MLRVNALACERGERMLFNNISFSIAAGQILQITGVNGAGKSSLLRLLAGFGQPYAGDIYWQDQPLAHYKGAYGRERCYVEHANGLKDSLTVEENLLVIESLLGNAPRPDYQPILAHLGLAEHANTLVECLSAGQKRRLALARLLLSSTRLWILDEPFTSLDGHSIELIESLLVMHCQHQGIIVMATHQLLSLNSTLIVNYELVPC